MKFRIRSRFCCSFSYSGTAAGQRLKSWLLHRLRNSPGADGYPNHRGSTQCTPCKATVYSGATALTPQMKVFNEKEECLMSGPSESYHVCLWVFCNNYTNKPQLKEPSQSSFSYAVLHLRIPNSSPSAFLQGHG